MNVYDYESLPHVDILDKPDYQTVMEHYALNSKPVLIRGVAQEWPAYEKWTIPELSQKYGDTKVITKRKRVDAETRDRKIFSLSEYLSYIQNTMDEEPYYLSDWSFSYDYPELLNDYVVPSYFENWLRRIPEYMLKRKDSDYLLRWMYIGPRKSGSPMHRDVMDTSAWNAVLSGKKEWLFFHKDETDNLYPDNQYSSSLNCFNADLDKYPKLKGVTGYKCIQEQGDLMFTPSLWWHQVRNLEAGISLTENFINHSNINLVTANYQTIAGRDPMLDTAIKEFIPEIEVASLQLKR